MKDDLISRQQAIDALMERFKRIPTTAIRAKDTIENLPSAQPNLQPTCNQLATDIISRQAAIEAIAGCTNIKSAEGLMEYVKKHHLEDGWSGGVLAAINAVKDLSSAQPEEAIPVSWIEAKIVRFMEMDNSLSGLTASIIRTMLNEWRREQEGGTK